MLSPIIKSIAIGCVLCVLADEVAMAAPGDLDTSFGRNGIGVVGVTSDPLTGKRIAVQSDGKIVVARLSTMTNSDQKLSVSACRRIRALGKLLSSS